MQRSPESLLEELVKKGIIKRYPEVYLKDFLGEPSYVPAKPDVIGTRFSQADVRRFVTEYGILPLGKRRFKKKDLKMPTSFDAVNRMPRGTHESTARQVRSLGRTGSIRKDHAGIRHLHGNRCHPIRPDGD